MLRIEVVRERELRAGYVTEGIAREKAFESENFVVSRTRVAEEESRVGTIMVPAISMPSLCRVAFAWSTARKEERPSS